MREGDREGGFRRAGCPAAAAAIGRPPPAPLTHPSSSLLCQSHLLFISAAQQLHHVHLDPSPVQTLDGHKPRVVPPRPVVFGRLGRG